MELISRRIAAALGLLLIGCARIAPPPGGPVDTTAPVVVSVSPDSLATAVAVDAPIEIVFTESIDPRSLETALWVTPNGVSKPRISFSGTSARIELANPLPDSTTIGILLTTGVLDKRRGGQQNTMKAPYRWYFSTGDTVDPGRVRGDLKTAGLSSTGQVLVALFDSVGDSLPDPSQQEPRAIVQSTDRQTFDLPGLPVDGKTRWLYALYDRDGNRQLGGTGEFVSARPESVTLVAGDASREVNLRLVDPTAPGVLQGLLVRTPGDSTEIWVELFDLKAAGSPPAVKRARTATLGSFEVPGVAPGRYRVESFCDLDRDSRRGENEDQVILGEFEVAAGEITDIGEFEAPRCAPDSTGGTPVPAGDQEER